MPENNGKAEKDPELSPEPYVLAQIVFFSIAGTLARIGLTAMGTYPRATVFPLVWAQAGGCLVIGFARGSRSAIERTMGTGLYIGITTGFCGSLTTFSSWMLDVFAAFANYTRIGSLSSSSTIYANNAPLSQSRFHCFVQGVLLTFVTMSVSYAALIAGSHSSPILSNFLNLYSSFLPKRSHIDRFFTVLGLLSWLTAILLCALYPPWRYSVAFAMVFAPFGALLRYFLAKVINPHYPSFPLGTFIANQLATALLALFTILSFTRPPPRSFLTLSSLQSSNKSFSSFLTCATLNGLIQGITGCLSTVSTFIAECTAFPRVWLSWQYFLTSWISAQLLLVLIIGSYSWSTHNRLDNNCSSYYT